MDEVAHAEKKREEAKRLRGLEPADTLRMGFDMMRFGRRLREAGSRGRP